MTEATKVGPCGTYARYQRGCRCDRCKNASREYMAWWRSRAVLGRGDERHGTINGYDNFGCRCAACRAAHQASRPVSRLLLREQLRDWFTPADPHPFVGMDTCLVCDKPNHDEEGTTS